MATAPLSKNLVCGTTLTAALLMAACGGGGSTGSAASGTAASSNAGAASGAATGNAAPDVTGVFAEPSGPLCTTLHGTVCTEPTSSSGLTEQQILALAHDANGLSFEMTRSGLFAALHEKQTTTRYKDPSKPSQSIYEESSRSWETQIKTFVLGKRQATYENTSFPFSKDTPGKVGESLVSFGTGSATQPQANGDVTITTNAVTLQQSPQTPLTFGRVVSTASGVTTETSTSTIHSSTGDIAYWSTSLELLTDRASVVTPPDHVIQYLGQVGLEGGSGTPVGDGRNLDTISGACPIFIYVDTVTGAVTIPNVICADTSEKKDVTMNFSFGPMTVKGSRISSLLQNEVSGSATGLSTYTTMGPKAPVNAVVSSNKISGQITGNNAQTITIHTSGPRGSIVIGGRRTN